MEDDKQVEINARFAAIIATSDDAIVSKDTNGIVQSWNQAAERIFGFAAHEMIGQPLLKIIPPERHDEETHILRKIHAGERVDHFQTIRMTKDGRRINVSVTISPIKDASGKVIGASKIARDITQIVRSQRERERLYDLSRLMAAERDLKTLLQKITDIATELSGAEFGAFFYNVSTLEGQSYTLYTIAGVPEEKFKQFPMPRNTQVFAPTFNGEGIVRSDDITADPRFGKNAPHHGMPQGHLPVRSYLAVPVFDASGKVVGGLFFGHQRTGVFSSHEESIVASVAGNASIALENARLHRELAETATKFQQMANSIPQLAWMARPDGALFWFNDRWLEYTGLSIEAQSGEGWTQTLDPGDLPRVIASWKKTIQASRPWEETFRVRRHDGVYRWYLTRAVPQLDSQGNITFWFGTNTDVTEQRELLSEREELLVAERIARAESERLGRMKDEFLATLSHELRTPLNAILGWSQLIKRNQDDRTMLTEGVNVIERNARVQAQLIEDLLDMNRIVSGKLRLDVQRVDPATVVQRAIDVLRPTAETKGVRLTATLDPHAGPVSGDPNRLQQVLWNLLSNAIKFTPKGGKVQVVLERVNSHIEITVADTGRGMDAAFLPHAFERFRQSDASTTRHHGGLGLGLAIVKQLVELHGGHVTAKSDGPNLGSTFTVSLPLSLAKPENGARAHPTSSTGQEPFDDLSLEGIKVLVVDDERDSREMIAHLLGERKATIIQAPGADAGIEMVKTHRPNLILSDIGMPDKDGYTFIRELRALSAEQGGRTTAIALTAFARSEDRARAMLAGYQLHMPKPVEPHELIAAVASLALSRD